MEFNGCDFLQWWVWSLMFGLGNCIGILIAVFMGVDRWRQFFKELLGRS